LKLSTLQVKANTSRGTFVSYSQTIDLISSWALMIVSTPYLSLMVLNSLNYPASKLMLPSVCREAEKPKMMLNIFLLQVFIFRKACQREQAAFPYWFWGKLGGPNRQYFLKRVIMCFWKLWKIDGALFEESSDESSIEGVI